MKTTSVSEYVFILDAKGIIVKDTIIIFVHEYSFAYKVFYFYIKEEKSHIECQLVIKAFLVNKQFIIFIILQHFINYQEYNKCI